MSIDRFPIAVVHHQQISVQKTLETFKKVSEVLRRTLSVILFQSILCSLPTYIRKSLVVLETAKM